MNDREQRLLGDIVYMAVISGLIFIILVMFLRMVSAQDIDTNGPDIQRWFANLTNRMGGSCCGEGDAYPAKVTKMPSTLDDQGRESYRLDGNVCVTDPSAKEITVHGIHIKTRPELHGDMCHQFSWMKMTKEKHGNPFDYAIVFVNANGGVINDVYCVVILPMIY